MSKKLRLYGYLVGINLFISAFTFGGGYVVVPMVKKYFVTRRALFSEEELMEMSAIAQSTPGAIAINLVSLAGYRCAGVTGLCLSVFSAILPPLIILSAISLFYEAFAASRVAAALLRGMQAGAAALIVDFIVDMTAMILKKRSLLLDGMVAVSFALSCFAGVNVALILLCCCGVCLIRVWARERREKADGQAG